MGQTQLFQQKPRCGSSFLRKAGLTDRKKEGMGEAEINNNRTSQKWQNLPRNILGHKDYQEHGTFLAPFIPGESTALALSPLYKNVHKIDRTWTSSKLQHLCQLSLGPVWDPMKPTGKCVISSSQKHSIFKNRNSP